MTPELHRSRISAPRATRGTYALLVAFGLLFALAFGLGMVPEPDTAAMAGSVWKWLQSGAMAPLAAR